MLYLIYQANHPDLAYKGGQGPIVHLEADLHATLEWAESSNKRWAFTLSNAGSTYFEDRCDLAKLNEIDWPSVQATRWAGRGISPEVQEGKQAEFLVEHSFPWTLVERVGVNSDAVGRLVDQALEGVEHRPVIEIRKDWYY